MVRQVKVAHGGGYMAMTQQALNGMDIHTRLQQMGGEAMAQGMNATFAPKTSAISRSAIDALCGLNGN